MSPYEPGILGDWAGPCPSAGYNSVCITNTGTGFGALGDQSGSFASPLEPRLGPLQDKGGNVPTNRPFPHLTHALVPGSPALDAGKSSQSLDQGGAPRRYDDPKITNVAGSDGSDIGVMEDGHVRIVGLRSPNQNPSVLFTTLPAREHLLESEDALVSTRWMACI
jgi:hypothetical protein